MLMGDVCTRRCNFCAVDKGKPGHLDGAEPEYVATVVGAMRLDYCVLTSVTRDDLPDQGRITSPARLKRSMAGCLRASWKC